MIPKTKEEYDQMFPQYRDVGTLKQKRKVIAEKWKVRGYKCPSTAAKELKPKQVITIFYGV